MIIFIAGISMEFSSQFGFKDRGNRSTIIMSYKYLLELLFVKKCVYVELTEANYYFFGYKRFHQSIGHK